MPKARLLDDALRSTKEAIEAYLLVLKEDQVSAPVEESLFSRAGSEWKLQTDDFHAVDL